MTEKGETWESYLRRTASWAIRLEFALLHSIAYRSLEYGPALKVLCWFYEKRGIDVDKKKRGAKRYRQKEEPISFTYREAAARGLDHKKFARAIRELHAHGFIDVVRLGSGVLRDYSLFQISERWRTYGKDTFQAIEFPKNISFVARDEVTKRWIGRSPRQVQRPKSAVGQRPKSAVGSSVQRPKSAVVEGRFPEIPTAKKCPVFRTTRGVSEVAGSEMCLDWT